MADVMQPGGPDGAGQAPGIAAGGRAQPPVNAARPGGIPNVQVGMCTHRGPIRDLNEDLAGHRVPGIDGDDAPRGAVFVVADGMGGHQAGEVASRTAVETVIHEYYVDTEPHPGERLVRAVKVANRAIYEHAQLDPARSGMGTTLVAAALVGSRVYVTNVGDSRAYLLAPPGSGGAARLTQITVDHSWVAEQVEVGLMTREQMAAHPQRNLITRALGTQPSVVVDLFKGDLVAGDTLLLCSDGVCGALPEATLAHILAASLPQDAAEELVAQAALHGGEDNATALVVHAVAEYIAPPPAGEKKRDGGPGRDAPKDRAGAPGAEPGDGGPAAAGRERVLALLPDRAGELARAVVPWLEAQAARVGVPPLRSGATAARAIWALGAAVLVILVCLCAFALATSLVGRPRPSALEPLLGPIAASELDKIPAADLGYGTGEQTPPPGPGTAGPDRWPAPRFVLLVGQASAWRCSGAGQCSFQLEVAGQEHQVACPDPGTDPELDGEQVRVLAKVAAEVAGPAPLALTATLVELDQGRPGGEHDRQRIVGNIPDSEPIWVYGIIDDVLGPEASDRASRLTGERLVLAFGTWPVDGSSLSQVAHVLVHRPNGTYTLPPGANVTTTPPPTVTLQPTKESPRGSRRGL